MTSRISSPYLSHLDLPKPLTVRSSSLVVGARSAVARRVFHALQYLTSDQMIQYIGDIEFEAKVLLARIFSNLTKDEQDSLSFSIKSNYEYFEAILKYIDNYGINSSLIFPWPKRPWQ